MHKLRFRQIHLDYHTSEKIIGIGARFDAGEWAETLRQAHVDSITCFSRCHHGMIYHDTRFEARHPHLEVNLLKEQIEACHANDIRVPVYITVGWDVFMGRRHPEWLERTVEGRLAGAGPLQAGWPKLCLNTAYVEYVIEQTREVLETLPVDGLFFDIIHQGQCVCECCKRDMLAAGLRPEAGEDRGAFAQRVLDGFKQRMTREVRKLNTDCSIFYNAGHVSPAIRSSLDAYTHLELESLPSGGWGYAHFPMTIRYARTLGVGCLGMTGKFHTSWGDFSSFKNQAALEYECFTALANAAKCSIGDQLHPSGQLDAATYQLIGAVYGSVAEKEPWCRDAEALAEVAVSNPEAIGRAEGRLDPACAGAYRMLAEGHHQFDLADAESDFGRYAVLILPDKIACDDVLRARIDEFTASGGSLLLSHHSGTGPDETEFVLDGMALRYQGAAPFSPDFVKPRPAIADGFLPSEHVMYERAAQVEAVAGAEVLADVWVPYFNRTWEHFCSHRHTPVEKQGTYPAVVECGQVIYLAHPVFGGYQRHGARWYKQLVLNCLARLLPRPLVKTDAPSTADVTVTRQPDLRRTIVHVLHYIPERRSDTIDTIEDVIPLHDVTVQLRLDQRPGKAYMAPQGTDLPVTYADGYATVTVPEARGHQMVVFDEADA